MHFEQKTPSLGVLGGLGPLASAEFVKTIYEQSSLSTSVEQLMPRVLLVSDPSFPDRTERLLRGDSAELLARLSTTLQQLATAQDGPMVICCNTIHALLPQLPTALARRVISLFDVVFAELLEAQQPHLALCTIGTRQLGLFERHPAWHQASAYLRFPNDADQQAIHQMIYRIKLGGLDAASTALLHHLAETYRVSAFVAGCTEMHILAKQCAQARLPFGFLDPLRIIAQKLSHQQL